MWLTFMHKAHSTTQDSVILRTFGGIHDTMLRDMLVNCRALNARAFRLG